MKKQFKLAYFEVNTGYQTMEFNPTHFIDISSGGPKKESAVYTCQSGSCHDLPQVPSTHATIPGQGTGRGGSRGFRPD